MEYNVQFPGLGLDFTINRIAVTLFGLDIYWYGIIFAVALGVSFCIAASMAKKRGISVDHLIDVTMVGTVFAVICARIYYVAFAPFKYDSIWDMINIRDGGIAIYGAVIGAFVFGGLACKWRKIDMLEVFDITATCFLLGQSIGRWGNFINQEAFGTNTTLPWGMFSEGTRDYLQAVSSRLAAQGITVDPSMPVHPTFLYESLWCLLGFAILYACFNRKKFKGEMLCWYLAWYGVGRFFIEGLRTDSLETGSGMRTSQIVAVVTVVVALGIIVYMRNKLSKMPVTPVGKSLETELIEQEALQEEIIEVTEVFTQEDINSEAKDDDNIETS